MRSDVSSETPDNLDILVSNTLGNTVSTHIVTLDQFEIVVSDDNSVGTITIPHNGATNDSTQDPGVAPMIQEHLAALETIQRQSSDLTKCQHQNLLLENQINTGRSELMHTNSLFQLYLAILSRIKRFMELHLCPFSSNHPFH